MDIKNPDNPFDTLDDVLAGAFGDHLDAMRECVRFGYVNAGSEWHPRFDGVTMHAKRLFGGASTARRAVRVKAGRLDLDALRAKAEEVREAARAEGRRQQQRQEHRARQQERQAALLAELYALCPVPGLSFRCVGSEVHAEGTPEQIRTLVKAAADAEPEYERVRALTEHLKAHHT